MSINRGTSSEERQPLVDTTNRSPGAQRGTRNAHDSSVTNGNTAFTTAEEAEHKARTSSLKVVLLTNFLSATGKSHRSFLRQPRRIAC
jgi:hypothetical protein